VLTSGTVAVSYRLRPLTDAVLWLCGGVHRGRAAVVAALGKMGPLAVKDVSWIVGNGPLGGGLLDLLGADGPAAHVRSAGVRDRRIAV
jgi:hypothetical protein